MRSPIQFKSLGRGVLLVPSAPNVQNAKWHEHICLSIKTETIFHSQKLHPIHNHFTQTALSPCSPNAQWPPCKQPRDIVLLTCRLFLLCWLHLNCSGYSIREASMYKLVVVSRRLCCSKVRRMHETLAWKTTTFHIARSSSS